jgi:predicted nucleic acid-binding protein
MVFAYLLEGNPTFGSQARAAYEAIVRRGDRLCTSVFTLGEVLVLPRRQGNHRVISAITDFMKSNEVELMPFTVQTAEQYSRVRAESRLKAADAIHLATAMQGQVDVFVTNDHDVLRQTFADGPFIVGLDGRVF